MTRLVLVIACLVLFALALYGMRSGWRHRAGRQSALPPLGPVPAGRGEPLLGPLSGIYVGTTYAASWQDRLVVGGLGRRAACTATLWPSGVLIDRTGDEPIFIPSADLIEAGLARGLAGKVVGAGGLLVVRWRLGDVEADTGLRADDKSVYPAWVRAIDALIELKTIEPQTNVPSDGSARSEMDDPPSLIEEICHSAKGEQA